MVDVFGISVAGPTPSTGFARRWAVSCWRCCRPPPRSNRWKQRDSHPKHSPNGPRMPGSTDTVRLRDHNLHRPQDRHHEIQPIPGGRRRRRPRRAHPSAWAASEECLSWAGVDERSRPSCSVPGVLSGRTGTMDSASELMPFVGYYPYPLSDGSSGGDPQLRGTDRPAPRPRTPRIAVGGTPGGRRTRSVRSCPAVKRELDQVSTTRPVSSSGTRADTWPRVNTLIGPKASPRKSRPPVSAGPGRRTQG